MYGSKLTWMNHTPAPAFEKIGLLIFLLCWKHTGNYSYISVITYDTWCSWRRWWFLWCEAPPEWCSWMPRQQSGRFSGSFAYRALRCSGHTGRLPPSRAPSEPCMSTQMIRTTVSEVGRLSWNWHNSCSKRNTGNHHTENGIIWRSQYKLFSVFICGKIKQTGQS